MEGGGRTVDVSDDSKLGAKSSVYKSFISEGFVSIAGSPCDSSPRHRGGPIPDT